VIVFSFAAQENAELVAGRRGLFLLSGAWAYGKFELVLLERLVELLRRNRFSIVAAGARKVKPQD
jgi:hypothetical protein